MNTEETNRLNAQRAEDAKRISEAYLEAERAVAKVGTLLRTTLAGKYMWATRHRTAISGIKATLNIMRKDVPDYRGKEQDS
jgi:hypothetical protein